MMYGINPVITSLHPGDILAFSDIKKAYLHILTSQLINATYVLLWTGNMTNLCPLFWTFLCTLSIHQGASTGSCSAAESPWLPKQAYYGLVDNKPCAGNGIILSPGGLESSPDICQPECTMSPRYSPGARDLNKNILEFWAICLTLQPWTSWLQGHQTRILSDNAKGVWLTSTIRKDQKVLQLKDKRIWFSLGWKMSSSVHLACSWHR